MTPLPRMSGTAPYRWEPCVVLDAQEAKELLRALPQDSPLRTRLREAADEAAQLAGRLNVIEEGGAA
jgi:hypothetical protein